MAQERKKYTIDDIARELGVSKTTVSRALSGKGRIGKATVERVRAFVEEHEYRPNRVAQGLARSKTYNLGLVIPGEYSGMPFFRDCIDGICQEAYRYNYDILFMVAREDGRAQLQRLVDNHKVDGIILTRTVMNSGHVEFLKKSRMPFVVIGPSDDPEVTSIDNPNREASRELTDFLLMKGLRRLALVGGNASHYVNRSRKRGFNDAHQEKGFHPDPALLFMEVEDYRKAVRVADQIMLAECDGIVCMDEMVCALILSCLREKGIAVPARMKLASMYDGSQLESNLPPVTSIRFDTKGLGRNACMEILGMLGEELRDDLFPMNYQVILRESTQ